jgi:hypothetical protein
MDHYANTNFKNVEPVYYNIYAFLLFYVLLIPQAIFIDRFFNGYLSTPAIRFCYLAFLLLVNIAVIVAAVIYTGSNPYRTLKVLVVGIVCLLGLNFGIFYIFTNLTRVVVCGFVEYHSPWVTLQIIPNFITQEITYTAHHFMMYRPFEATWLSEDKIGQFSSGCRCPSEVIKKFEDTYLRISKATWEATCGAYDEDLKTESRDALLFSSNIQPPSPDLPPKSGPGLRWWLAGVVFPILGGVGLVTWIIVSPASFIRVFEGTEPARLVEIFVRNWRRSFGGRWGL